MFAYVGPMRTGEDEDALLSRARLRQLVVGVLTAIVVIGAVLPWLAVGDAWRTVGSDEFVADPTIGAMERLAIAVQALPFISIQAGDYGALAMGAAVGVILLTRSRRGESEDGMRWSPAQVLTAGAVVVALLAALLRLAMSVYTQVSLMGTVADQYLIRTGGMGAAVAVLAPAVPVLGWIAVVATGLRYRTAEAERAESGRASDAPADGESEQPTLGPPVVSEERSTAPTRAVDPAEIRADGASDSGYDEFRFRR